MERPNIKDCFSEKADGKTVHNEYINSPHLYSYASNLDMYVDYLEDKLSERENKPEPLESTELKALIIDGVIWRKFLPFIPLLGIPLTVIYHHKYGDTGLENKTLNWITAFWQAISFVCLCYAI
jgi:hypothetical protein